VFLMVISSFRTWLSLFLRAVRVAEPSQAFF